MAHVMSGIVTSRQPSDNPPGRKPVRYRSCLRCDSDDRPPRLTLTLVKQETFTTDGLLNLTFAPEA